MHGLLAVDSRLLVGEPLQYVVSYPGRLQDPLSLSVLRAMNQTRLLGAPLIAVIRLHRIALCIVLGIMLLYTLAGFFLVPYVARQQIERYVTDTLQRNVSIGDIRFNPFVFDASVSDFRLSEADNAPLVAFRHLYVNAQLASLWRRAVVLREVRLSAPNVELVIGKDATINLAKLIPAAAPEKKSEPLRVRIGTLAVIDGRVAIADYTGSQPFTAAVTPIRFTLNDFKTDAGFENAYDFTGLTTSGEQLAWSGQFTVEPLGSAGRFSVQKLKFATLDAYLEDSIPFRLASGEADLSGSYRFTLNPTLALDVTLPAVRVRELSVAQRASDATAPVVLPGIEIQDVAFSYDRRDVGIRRVDVNRARVDVALERDGSISLLKLLKGELEASPVAASAQPVDAGQLSTTGTASPWRVHVDTMHLADASIHAEDRGVQPTTRLELSPVQLTVDNWSTDAAAQLQVDADVTINQQARLLSKGELQLEPLSAQLAVELKAFDLPVIQPYLARTTDMTLHSGKLGVKGVVTYAATPDSAPPLTFKGEVQVADLRTTDQLVNEDFVKWRNLAITGIDYSQHPDRLNIERIVARQPYARVVIAKDTSLNVAKVLRLAPAPADNESEDDERSDNAPAARQKNTAAAVAAKPYPMRIGSVAIIDGSANFADYSIEPSFAAGILQLNGSVTGLSSKPASRATVKLAGKVDKYAPVDITGTINVLAATKYTDLALAFRNMELTTFNPYSGKFAGYNISKGKLSTELHYKVDDRKLDATHHIVLDNLEFGAKTDSKDAAPIPLKLAVALLKDRQGVIDLNLPVSGTLDDPKFRLGPIVWKAVLGLLTKIVTAPFAALGALFGGGDELAYVDFAPGSATLAATETQKLDKLAKALIERPQLKLNLPLTTLAAIDGEAMARAAMIAKLPADAAATEPLDERARRKQIVQLEKAYREVVGKAPEYPAKAKTDKQVDSKVDSKVDSGADLEAQRQFLERSLLEHLQPDDAALIELARARARAVQDALLAHAELNPERVFITTERADGKAQAAAVRMEMKLE